jgi:hypothetical protein
MIEIPPTDSKGLGRKWGVNGILTNGEKMGILEDWQKGEERLLGIWQETNSTYLQNYELE